MSGAQLPMVPVPEYARPEENTLGVTLGTQRRLGPSTASSAGRAMRQASARGASLGTGYLGVGAGVLAGLQGLAGIALFIDHAQSYPNIFPVGAAWLIYALALVGVALAIPISGGRMPNWLFIVFLCALASVVALDFISIASLHNVGDFATASVSVGFGLLVGLTLRPEREILAAVSILALALIGAIVLSTPLTPLTIPSQIVVVALAIMPALIGTFVLRRFRRIVQLELDRVLVQSIVSAPRFTVGMLASEELARLDLAAEELLNSVATGRITLPLTARVASQAASLATELRLHLIEGRRETWLYHAITESEQLGKSVTLTDRGSLAGLLDSKQRDGLLRAIWLLVSEAPKGSPTVQLTIGPVTELPDAAGRTITVPIIVTTTAVPRNRVDPAIWNAIGGIGRFNDSTHNSSVRVEIECVVANPADHQLDNYSRRRNDL